MPVIGLFYLYLLLSIIGNSSCGGIAYPGIMLYMQNFVEKYHLPKGFTERDQKGFYLAGRKDTCARQMPEIARERSIYEPVKALWILL
jgi:hypothetical protein